MLSDVPVEFRIAFLSDIEYRDEAKEWEREVKERLPKREGFRWKEYSWRRSWSAEQLQRVIALGEWADAILGFGSCAAWDQMAAWPEVTRWREEGKIFLWLHV